MWGLIRQGTNLHVIATIAEHSWTGRGLEKCSWLRPGGGHEVSLYTTGRRAIIVQSRPLTVSRMTSFSPIPHRHPIRVVLSSPALQRFLSVRNAAALVIAQLGIAAFFVSGDTPIALGPSAGWFVLVAAGLAVLVRAIVESWALLMPGGFEGRIVAALARAQRASR